MVIEVVWGPVVWDSNGFYWYSTPKNPTPFHKGILSVSKPLMIDLKKGCFSLVEPTFSLQKPSPSQSVSGLVQVFWMQTSST